MSVAYTGFNVNTLTFKCSAKITEGSPVRINKSDSVVSCADGNEFHGIVVDSDTKYVSVQMSGIATLPYTGTAPTTGFNILCANGSAGVKVSTSGNRYLVVSVDETKNTVTFLM